MFQVGMRAFKQTTQINVYSCVLFIHSRVGLYVIHKFWSRRKETCLRGLSSYGSIPRTQLQRKANNLKTCKWQVRLFPFLESEKESADQTAMMHRPVCTFVVRMHQRQVFSRRGPFENQVKFTNKTKNKLSMDRSDQS